MLYQNHLWFARLNFLHFLSRVWRQYSPSKRATALGLASSRPLELTIAISFNDGVIWEAADWQLPPEREPSEVTAGLSTLPGCPRLWPRVIPVHQYKPFPARSHMPSCILCGGQTVPRRSSSCTVISGASIKPFPPSPHLFLVIQTRHSTTHRTDLSFFRWVILAYVCVHIKTVFLCVWECLWFQLSSYSTTCRFGISSVSKQQLQPWHISECFFSRSLRKWSAPRLLIPLHSTVHQGDFVFAA